MIDPQPKPLAEAREDREKVAELLRNIVTYSGDIYSPEYVYSLAEAREWLNGKPVSASPAPETDALRDALGLAKKALAEAAQSRWSEAFNAQLREALAAIAAALHTPSPKEGETPVVDKADALSGEEWQRRLIQGWRLWCKDLDKSGRTPTDNDWSAFNASAFAITRKTPSPTPAPATGDTEFAKLNEYDKDEWWDVCRKARPDLTLEEFEAMWREFVRLKAAPHTSAPAPAIGQINRLRAIHSALAEALGDRDITHIEDDTELREQEPVQWAASKLAEIVFAGTQPPVPPAADAEGWWVKPEWKRVSDEDYDLYVMNTLLGWVTSRNEKWYVGGGEVGGDTAFDTREAAQAALLAAVRPKDAGAKP